MNSVPFTEQQKILLKELLRAGAVLTGDAVRARFGLNSPIYFDLRENLYARPSLLWKVGGEFARKISELTRNSQTPQCVVGVPDTATPLALAAALYAWKSSFVPRSPMPCCEKRGNSTQACPRLIGSGKRTPPPASTT